MVSTSFASARARFEGKGAKQQAPASTKQAVPKKATVSTETALDKLEESITETMHASFTLDGSNDHKPQHATKYDDSMTESMTLTSFSAFDRDDELSDSWSLTAECEAWRKCSRRPKVASTSNLLPSIEGQEQALLRKRGVKQPIRLDGSSSSLKDRMKAFEKKKEDKIYDFVL